MGILTMTRRPLQDEEIIELYWKRNERAIEETDRKYRSYLFAVTYNILHSNEDSEECLNDTYLGAWGAMPPERPTYLKAFLTTIVRRVSINRYNSQARQKRVPSNMTESLSELELFLSDDSFEKEQEAQYLGGVISAYVKDLSKRQRYIFMSRYYLAEPIENIARELGISRSMVNKEIAAIKNGLKEALKKEGYMV